MANARTYGVSSERSAPRTVYGAAGRANQLRRLRRAAAVAALGADPTRHWESKCVSSLPSSFLRPPFCFDKRSHPPISSESRPPVHSDSCRPHSCTEDRPARQHGLPHKLDGRGHGDTLRPGWRMGACPAAAALVPCPQIADPTCPAALGTHPALWNRTRTRTQHLPGTTFLQT